MQKMPEKDLYNKKGRIIMRNKKEIEFKTPCNCIIDLSLIEKNYQDESFFLGFANSLLPMMVTAVTKCLRAPMTKMQYM